MSKTYFEGKGRQFGAAKEWYLAIRVLKGKNKSLFSFIFSLYNCRAPPGRLFWTWYVHKKLRAGTGRGQKAAQILTKLLFIRENRERLRLRRGHISWGFPMRDMSIFKISFNYPHIAFIMSSCRCTSFQPGCFGCGYFVFPQFLPFLISAAGG